VRPVDGGLLPNSNTTAISLGALSTAHCPRCACGPAWLVLKGAQGSELWDYVYGPEGVETWRFDIDRNRKVGSATQLLTQERLYRVVPGVSTADDVKMLLGKPREIVKLGGETAWEWRVAMPPEVGVFVVRFGPDGKASGYNVLEDIKSDDAVP